MPSDGTSRRRRLSQRLSRHRLATPLPRSPWSSLRPPHTPPNQLHRISSPGNGSHSTLALLVRARSTHVNPKCRFRQISLTGHCLDPFVEKAASIHLDSEFAAAIFGASSTEHFCGTKQPLTLSPSRIHRQLHIVAHTTIPFHILDRSKLCSQFRQVARLCPAWDGGAGRICPGTRGSAVQIERVSLAYNHH